MIWTKAEIKTMLIRVITPVFWDLFEYDMFARQLPLRELYSGTPSPF